MKEFLLLPAVGGIFIFMYEMLKKFDAFCDANRQNLWLEEDAVPEEKEESALGPRTSHAPQMIKATQTTTSGS